MMQEDIIYRQYFPTLCIERQFLHPRNLYPEIGCYSWYESSQSFRIDESQSAVASLYVIVLVSTVGKFIPIYPFQYQPATPVKSLYL